jgi:hypothetical protein
MLTIKIHGGLGNQIFEYAFGRAFSLRLGSTLQLDPASLLDNTPRPHVTKWNYILDQVFAIQPPIILPARITKVLQIYYVNTVFNRFYPVLLSAMGYWRYVKERTFAFDPFIFELRGNLYLNGYWQSERYFSDYESTIRKDLTFRHSLQGEAARLGNAIAAAESVCVHVRRQDKIWGHSSRKLHMVAPIEYYDKALAFIRTKLGRDLKVYVFSDDTDWCRQHLRFSPDQVVVADELAGPGGRDHLQLMTLCKHFIIPESTFSWWAAWLSGNKNKIIVAPREWFCDKTIDTKDVVPAFWARI